MKKHNYGFDLLRTITMLFVILLHILGYGGVLKLNLNIGQYMICWTIEIICYCAVDCFALITGYVSYSDADRNPKFDRIINMWFQVLFFIPFFKCILYVNWNRTILFEIFNKGGYYR